MLSPSTQPELSLWYTSFQSCPVLSWVKGKWIWASLTLTGPTQPNLFVFVATFSKPHIISRPTITFYSCCYPSLKSHPQHLPDGSLFFISLVHFLLPWFADTGIETHLLYLCSFTVTPLSLSFTHMKSVLLQLTFIPLFSTPYLHLSYLSSTCSLLLP